MPNPIKTLFQLSVYNISFPALADYRILRTQEFRFILHRCISPSLSDVHLYNGIFILVPLFCRLALKAFTDQKRRFFPHLADDSAVGSASKKLCTPLPISHEEISDHKTLGDILSYLEKDIPNLQAFTYQRLDWLKRASQLPSANESSTEPSKDLSGFQSTSKWRQSSTINAAEKAAVIELLLPPFRAVA